MAERDLNHNEVAIQVNHAEIVTRGQASLEKETRAALSVVSAMMGKNLYASFQIWKRNAEAFKINLRTKFKSRLIALYK